MKPFSLAFLGVLAAALAAPLAGLRAAKDKPSATYTIPLPPPPDFSPLEWVTGEWKGTTTGRGAQGEVHLSVELALDKKFMIFREDLSLPSTTTAPATRESWLGVMSGSRPESTFILRVFSTTGFVTRYRVSVDGPEIRFDPDGGEPAPPGWLFRRVIERSSPSEITETVQVAPPRKAFFDYYTARLTRVHP